MDKEASNVTRTNYKGESPGPVPVLTTLGLMYTDHQCHKFMHNYIFRHIIKKKKKKKHGVSQADS